MCLWLWSDVLGACDDQMGVGCGGAGALIGLPSRGASERHAESTATLLARGWITTKLRTCVVERRAASNLVFAPVLEGFEAPSSRVRNVDLPWWIDRFNRAGAQSIAQGQTRPRGGDRPDWSPQMPLVQKLHTAKVGRASRNIQMQTFQSEGAQSSLQSQ
jgi:hypothetical protein